jgi:hypothetical protein
MLGSALSRPDQASVSVLNRVAVGQIIASGSGCALALVGRELQGGCCGHFVSYFLVKPDLAIREWDEGWADWRE